jgi:uncharacterized protein
VRALLVPLVAGTLVLVGGPALADTPYPAPAVCVDQAGALSAGTCARITTVLDQDERTSPEHDEIAVAVVGTTGGTPIETWATGLFNDWGVGQADQDNGVLLVVALEDRALRIATGDGLRTRLPDGTASEIIGGTMTPLLRAGRTEDAVLAGLDGIRTALGHDISGSALAAGVTPPYYAADEPSEESGSGSSAGLWILLLAGLVVVGVVWSYASGSSSSTGGDDSWSGRRSYSPRRSFSSSSSSRRSSSSSRRSSFGGGRSSGGGSSGRW